MYLLQFRELLESEVALWRYPSSEGWTAGCLLPENQLGFMELVLLRPKESQMKETDKRYRIESGSLLDYVKTAKQPSVYFRTCLYTNAEQNTTQSISNHKTIPILEWAASSLTCICYLEAALLSLSLLVFLKFGIGSILSSRWVLFFMTKFSFSWKTPDNSHSP